MERLRSRPLRLLLLAGAIAVPTVLVYLPSLQVPWYLDDLRSIVENPALRDLGGACGGLLRPRGLAYLTFALNYRLGGTGLTGFHLVNLAIHVGTAFLVYLLLRRGARFERNWALAGTLFFALHPLQTQAVTYVVQRMTSLSGFCFLLSCLLYLAARDDERRSRLWLVAAWLAGAAALLSKESAAVLPLALWLCERLLRPGRPLRAQLLTLLPFCLLPAGLVLTRLLLPLAGGEELTALASLDRLATLRAATPLHYLVTEFAVLWLYLRLIVLPLGQGLEYDWPIVDQLFSWPQLAAGLGLALLLLLAWRVRRRRPLTSLGIAWFFLTLSVESSLIPLDPVFEHRLYLPLWGAVLVALDQLQRVRRPAWWQGGALVVLIVLAVLTWQRNRLWGDPVAFYEDNLRRAPRNERVCDELANRYFSRGDTAAAETIVRRGLALNPDYYRLWNTLGLIEERRGAFDAALAAYRRAIELKPDYYLAYSNLGVVYSNQRRWDDALDWYRRALALHDNANTRFNCGVACYNQQRYDAAREEFRRALQLNPDDPDTLYNYGVTLLRLGQGDAAAALLPRLERLDRRRAGDFAARLGQVRGHG